MKELITGLFAGGVGTLLPEAAIYIAVGWALGVAWRYLRKEKTDSSGSHNVRRNGGSSKSDSNNSAIGQPKASGDEDVEPQVVEQDSIESLLEWANSSRGEYLRTDEVIKTVVTPIIGHMNTRMTELEGCGMGCSGHVIWGGILANGEKWFEEVFDFNTVPEGIPEESYGLETEITLRMEMQGLDGRKATVRLEGSFQKVGNRIEGKWQLGWKIKRSKSLNESRAGAYNLEKTMWMIDEDLKENIGGWKSSELTSE